LIPQTLIFHTDRKKIVKTHSSSIIKNIWEISQNILQTATEKYPEYEFRYLEPEQKKQIMAYNHSVVSEIELYTPLCHQSILSLSKEPIFQKILEDNVQKEFFVHEGFQFQIKRENLLRYFPGFVPTKEDVLNCHQKTSGIDKVYVTVNSDTKIKLYDTGGQRYFLNLLKKKEMKEKNGN
jgi:hypothetical protein